MGRGHKTEGSGGGGGGGGASQVFTPTKGRGSGEVLAMLKGVGQSCGSFNAGASFEVLALLKWVWGQKVCTR